MKMKRRGLKALTVLISLFLALTFTGCDEPAGSSHSEKKTYVISVVSGIANGSVTPNVTRASAGTNITLTIAPNNGFRLKTGTLSVMQTGGLHTVSVADNVFIMPAYNVTVSAEFEVIPAEQAENHLITVASGITNGSVTLDVTSAPAGVSITLTITPNNGYRLKAGTLSVTQTGGSQFVTVTDNKFTMPAFNVTVNAEFEVILGTTFYSITINPAVYGSVTTNTNSAVEGVSITLNIHPDDGYRLKTLTVTPTVNISGSLNFRTFTMPSSNVTVTVVFELLPEGSIVVSFEDFTDQEIDLSVDSGFFLSQDNSLTITAGDFNYLYGVYLDGYYFDSFDENYYDGTCSIYLFGEYFIEGTHTLSIIFYKDEIYYSKVLKFKVIK